MVAGVGRSVPHRGPHTADASRAPPTPLAGAPAPRLAARPRPPRGCLPAYRPAPLLYFSAARAIAPPRLAPQPLIARSTVAYFPSAGPASVDACRPACPRAAASLRLPLLSRRPCWACPPAPPHARVQPRLARASAQSGRHPHPLSRPPHWRWATYRWASPVKKDIKKN
nr:DBF4-type zinc finger-containing protein 2 homolog [Aegilops tauschii subsp. strangulata]